MVIYTPMSYMHIRLHMQRRTHMSHKHTSRPTHTDNKTVTSINEPFISWIGAVDRSQQGYGAVVTNQSNSIQTIRIMVNQFTQRRAHFSTSNIIPFCYTFNSYVNHFVSTSSIVKSKQKIQLFNRTSNILRIYFGLSETGVKQLE